MRHCAFCLKEIVGNQIKLCGKCHRRAYCGTECQRSDWTTRQSSKTTPGYGQGHKNWCGLHYGEEDLEWKIQEIEGKGLGVVALKEFSENVRVMVDACQPYPQGGDYHPNIDELYPANSSLEKRFAINAAEAEAGGPGVLCLRFSRLNHDCDNNATHFYDEVHKSKVVFSTRKIAAGEEICISYGGIRKFGAIPAASLITGIIPTISLDRWGIVCPAGCICKDRRMNEIAMQCHKLDSYLDICKYTGDFDNVLSTVKKLIRLLELAKFSGVAKTRTAYIGFKVGIMSSKTLDEGMNYLKYIYEIEKHLYHPKSKDMQITLKYLKDPTCSKKYLVLD